jgi:hypothetical protein
MQEQCLYALELSCANKEMFLLSSSASLLRVNDIQPRISARLFYDEICPGMKRLFMCICAPCLEFPRLIQCEVLDWILHSRF